MKESFIYADNAVQKDMLIQEYYYNGQLYFESMMRSLCSYFDTSHDFISLEGEFSWVNQSKASHDKR